jgi:hypothetical protein
MNKKVLLVLGFSALGLAACAHRYNGTDAYYGYNGYYDGYGNSDGYYGYSDGYYRDGYDRHDRRRWNNRDRYRRYDGDGDRYYGYDSR